MTEIFNFFGNILGYLLWFFYTLIQNYGVAIILFTLVLKIVMFPFSINQQKSMAANSKMAAKQKELQKKYGNDKVKLQEETQKLYDKEGINPASGCLTTFIPFPIMIGLFYTVQNPLANALHLSADGIAKAVEMLRQIPGLGASFSAQYAQIEIVKHFAQLKPQLTMFSAAELTKIESFSHGFQFMGLNLLDTPSDGANIFGTLFRSNLWVIPVLCLATSLVTQYFMMKMQPGMQQQQGCMKGMLYLMPLFSAWLACTMPAAVGFYWIISTIFGFLQTIILNIWYSPADLNAKAEAQRVALLEENESKMKPVAGAFYRNQEINPQPQQRATAKSGASKTKTKGGKTNSDDYLGMKK
ncbi:YidC/Oxa1 family membrane protein insertase [Caproiciproducens sp. CPB-2]|uniref:YidC/Oxa1 family membrane protein insertase n=1 Tax=Caproiciproducens sp. CPB-2 TaxID=3030017 RepID=UPI0023DA0B91|nr:YidC/Oxa1 family membrane protein insertase [Caproiciproducens sp. CPB-2]MDF1494737.1 YidC/Oxa1 family membrane protein insertase [Caproiciproducens sp. CPB-2]